MGKNWYGRGRKDRRDAGGGPPPPPEAPASDAGGPPAIPATAGTLYVVATPIGNLEDITYRAVRILGAVPLIAAEDTRRTRILLDHYGIVTPLTSLYDQNEAKKSARLIARLQAGQDLAYVSDAGTPGISDPGFVLVREAILGGVRVVPVPGPSALITALSVSGLPMENFIFCGFLPAKPLRRRQLLTALREEERTLIFYESPHRLAASLRDIDACLGDREVVLSREVTKIHEEFIRGPARAVLARLGDGTVKGEVTLIVAGGEGGAAELSDAELLERAAELRRAAGEGGSLRDMADRIAGETGLPRRRIYRLLLFS